MSSLATRSLVLAIARLLSQALMMLSPIFLVRLLDVVEFGRYRQFTVTAGLLTMFGTFSISGSLTYFVSKAPQLASAYVTNACLLLLGSTSATALVAWICRDFIVPASISDYTLVLVAYSFLFANLDVFTSYALARGRSDLVLGYSLGQIALRLAATVGSAAVFHEVGPMFAAMLITEAVKTLAVYVWLRAQKLITFHWNAAAAREQLRFIMPFGSGTLLNNLNDNIGRLLVSSIMGPRSLAIYAIAAYNVPIVTILKQALSEAIFPEMVKRSTTDPKLGLRLWQRTNVVYLLFVCPSWLLMTYWAEPIVRILFTKAYLQATPYFQVLLLLMLRQCFDFSTPLRGIGYTAPFVTANGVALIVDVLLTVTLIGPLGLWAPIIGIMVSQAWLMVYFAVILSNRYGVSIAQLLEWRSLAVVGTATAAAFSVLWGVELAAGRSLATAATGLIAFAAVYVSVLRIGRVEEFAYLVNSVRQHLLQLVANRRA